MVPEFNNHLRTVFAHNTDDKVEKKDALCNFVLPPEVLVSALFDSAFFLFKLCWWSQTYSQVITLSSEKMMDLKICDILLCETTSNSTVHCCGQL